MEAHVLNGPVQIKNVVEADRLKLKPSVSPDTFEIYDSKLDEVLGTVRQASDSRNEVELYHGKGGLCAVITSAAGLKYFGLPGSTMKVQGTEISLEGSPCVTNPEKRRKHIQRGQVQTHTDQAMILGAGLATRFEPISGSHTEHSKPAVYLLGDKTVIGCIADTLARDGFTRLFINTYFMPVSLKKALESAQSESIFYIDEAEPSGTAGGLRKLLSDPQCAGALNTGKPLMIIQGDAVTDANLSDLMEAHIANHAFMTIGCQPVPDKDVDKFGIIVTDHSGVDGISGQITGFQEKPKLSEAKSRLGNTGFYIISPQAYPVILEIYREVLTEAQAKARAEGRPEPGEVLFDFANDIFPRVLKRVNEGKVQGKFWAQAVEGYWSDIGNPAQYLESVHDLYAGKIDFPMPEQPDLFYRAGVVYWPGAQRIADGEGAELRGNVVVARPFSPDR